VSLFEARAEIPPAETDRIEELLLELGLENWSLLEDAIARRAWIVGLFPGEREAVRHWADLKAILALAREPEIQIQALPESAWRDSYKAHFHAWTFGRLHWVPVWEQASFALPPGDAVLWLDPGMAFGTGNHETTRLCIERLIARTAAGRSVVDAGCGSGILSLSAHLLGFGPVFGFDVDPEAVRVSLENAALNGLDGRVVFATAGLEDGLEGRQADVVLANIQADILMAHSHRLVGAVAPAGVLILSGILAAENGQVRAAFERAAPSWPIQTRILGEWSDLCVERPPR